MQTGHHLLVDARILTIALHSLRNRRLSTAYVDLVLLDLLLLLLRDNRLDEGGLAVDIDSVSTLQVLNIIVQESLVIS